MTIGIVNIGIGNIGSLQHALHAEGWDAVQVDTPAKLDTVTHLILPGVGAFPAAMDRINDAELLQPIKDYALSGRPLLGICLGMQLLASVGTEDGMREGLALIQGTVRRLPQSGETRLPHVGWNEVDAVKEHPLLEKVRNAADMYFVHSYRFEPENDEEVIANTTYGEKFVSIVGRDNVIGVQFHPEKSQFYGLRILDNFCLWDGKC